MADFVFTVTTSSPNETFTLPLQSNGSYDFNVDWGDSSNDDITAWDDAAKTHTYVSADTYTVTIDVGVSGEITGWAFQDSGDVDLIQDISAWGDLNLGNNGGYFFGCSNLTISAVDTLDLTGTTDLSEAFRDCSSLTTNAAMNSWDVSAVTSMHYMFFRCSNFNQDIGNWNTAAVTSMHYMFRGCANFDQDIDGWDVSAVTNMQYMFENCAAFNQGLNSWDVSAVTNMGFMFYGCAAFNGSVVSWTPSACTIMYHMFRGCAAFNQDIGGWDVSAVTAFQNMFYGCTNFNQNLNNWDTSSATDMSYMFYLCPAFDGNISGWNVSKVTNMKYMFRGCSNFNQYIGGWNVAAVTDMSFMFLGCADFNQNIAGWNVAAVTDMSSMFSGCSDFNRDIGSWDVSAVMDMSSMFWECVAFDQDLGDWDVSSVTDMEYMIYGNIVPFNNVPTLSTVNYNSLLNGWSKLSLQNDVVFHAGLSRYSIGAETFRQTLVNTYNWTITDGGVDPSVPFNPETIRERIILALMSNLAGITSANGYNTNIGANVQRVKSGLTDGELPSLIIWPQVEETVKIHGKSKITMPVKIEGISRFTKLENPSVVSELMLGDIRKMMEMQGSGNSVTDGLSDSIQYSSGGSDEYPEPGNDRVGVYAIYNIEYKTLAGNPYSQ